MKYIKEFWKNAFNAKGRISKKDYFITWLIIYGINSLTFLGLYLESNILIMIGLLHLLITICPLYIMAIRRLHDMNESGWYVIFLFIPFVYIIFGIYLFFANGIDENNEYGDIVEDISKNTSWGKIIGTICIVILIIVLLIFGRNYYLKNSNKENTGEIKTQFKNIINNNNKSDNKSDIKSDIIGTWESVETVDTIIISEKLTITDNSFINTHSIYSINEDKITSFWELKGTVTFSNNTVELHITDYSEGSDMTPVNISLGKTRILKYENNTLIYDNGIKLKRTN